MRLRKLRITPIDRLAMDVGAVMERATMRAAHNVGRPDASPGYYIIAKRRSVEVYYVETRSNTDFASRQTGFIQRVQPLLEAQFGAERVKRKSYEGVFQGFEVRLK